VKGKRLKAKGRSICEGLIRARTNPLPFAFDLSPQKRLLPRKKIKFGTLPYKALYLEHYLVAIPRSINTPHIVRVLIYKEAARDQAQ
jgi:hypothetical protein